MPESWRLGCIGVGAMGEALVAGVMRAGVVDGPRIVVADADETRAREVAARLGVDWGTNDEVARRSDVLLVAVNPGHVAGVLHGVKAILKDGALVISVAAGVTLAALEGVVGSTRPVIRAMPNTPCLIGTGAVAISLGRGAGSRDAARAEALFGAVGKVVTVPEGSMDAVTGLSGSGPAYVFTVINALIDGGVAAGLDRRVARDLAVHTVIGSARLVAESGDHPIVLRDRVTSPGGTTAAGLAVLEQNAVVGAFIDAVRTAARRSEEMGRQASPASADAGDRRGGGGGRGDGGDEGGGGDEEGAAP